MATWREPHRSPPAMLRVDETGVYIEAEGITESGPLTTLDDPIVCNKIYRHFGLIGLVEALTCRTLLGAPPAPPTGGPCACGVDRLYEHPQIEQYERLQDTSAPVDYLITAARCRACGRWWTFEESGDTHYEYRWYARPLSAVEWVQ